MRLIDIVPLTDRNKRSCKNTKAVSVPQGTDHVTIEWEVGGGITVDETCKFYDNYLCSVITNTPTLF